MSTRTSMAASAVATILAVASVATAQAAEQEWDFELMPYLWATGLDGNIVIGNQPVSIDASFSDLVKALEIGGGLLMRAERAHWVLWTQADYFALSTDKLNDPPEHGRLDTDVTLLTAGFGRQFVNSNERISVDVLLGIRYFSLDNTLRFDTLGTFGHDRSYTDPVIIVRPSFRLSDRWWFSPMFSFGSGGDSEKTYELEPVLQFQMSEQTALHFGYRKLHYEIENSGNGNSFDGAFEGLMIGVNFTFGDGPES